MKKQFLRLGLLLAFSECISIILNGLEDYPLVTPSQLSPLSQCSNFFTVLSEIQPFRTLGMEPCADTFLRMDYFFRSLSSQMSQLNSTLHIFTTYHSNPYCHVPYPNIQLRYFDIFDLFQEYSVENLIPIFESIYYDDYAKVSDILRILLALKYSMTYIDLDIHFLNLNRSIYEVEFVTMHIWNQNSCSLEITNAAFCLSPTTLRQILSRMVRQISGGNIYKSYTELGPNLFAKTLTNLPTLLNYYTLNHPETFYLPDMISDYQRYGHHLLHLTSSFRQLLNSAQNVTYEVYMDHLRSLLGLQELHLPPSVATPESYYYALQAMIINHPTYPNHLSLCLQLAELSVNRHIQQCQKEKYREDQVEESYYESIEILNKVLVLTSGEEGELSEDLKSAREMALKWIQDLDQKTCTSLGTD